MSDIGSYKIDKNNVVYEYEVYQRIKIKHLDCTKCDFCNMCSGMVNHTRGDFWKFKCANDILCADLDGAFRWKCVGKIIKVKKVIDKRSKFEKSVADLILG